MTIPQAPPPKRPPYGWIALLGVLSGAAMQASLGTNNAFLHSAEGRALSVQGELINSEVKIFAQDGRIVAQGSTIYRIIDRGEQAPR